MSRCAVLGIDTATPLGTVAMVDATGVVAEWSGGVSGSHGARLMEAVDRVITLSGLCLSELSGIAVSVGPGSFTGLRVGIATAMGLARARNLALFAVPTLEAIAWGCPAEHVAVVMAARKDEVYAAAYRRDGTELGTLYGPVARPPDLAARDLMALAVPLAVAGTGAAEVFFHMNGVYTLLPPVFARPRAALVAWRGQVAAGRGEGAAPHQIAPLYLGPSQAEISWAKRQNP